MHEYLLLAAASPRKTKVLALNLLKTHGGKVSPDGQRARMLSEQKAKARTLARAKALAGKLSTATEQVSSSIHEANRVIHGLKKTMQQVAVGSQQASSTAQEFRTAINQILQQLAKDTTSDIEGLISGVGAAAKANVESAKMITELERLSEEVGRVVQAVAHIADQTNSLALNAVAEATQAGELNLLIGNPSPIPARLCKRCA